jgi:hypothetical protein
MNKVSNVLVGKYGEIYLLADGRCQAIITHPDGGKVGKTFSFDQKNLNEWMRKLLIAQTADSSIRMGDWFE